MEIFTNKHNTIKLTYNYGTDNVRLKCLLLGDEMILNKLEVEELLPILSEWLGEE